MKKILFIFICFGVFFPISSYAGYNRGGDILVQTDVARFKASKGYSYIEVYLEYPRDKFKRKIIDKKLEAQIEVRVNIIMGDSLVSSKSWQMADRIDTAQTVGATEQVFDQYTTFLKKGEYKLKVMVRDQIGKIAGWAERDFVVSPFPEKQLSFSDIQFSYKIIPSKKKSKFVKNSFYIFPNPGSIYGNKANMLYYYSEIYNLAPLQAGIDSTYQVDVTVQDLKGNLIIRLPAKIKKRQGASLVEMGQINVAALNSGVYRLVIDAIDRAVQDTAIQTRNFMIYGGEHLASTAKSDNKKQQSNAIEFSGMSEKKLDEMFDKCRYIATKDEKKVYKKLKLDSKRKFMTNFWRSRDTDKSTPVNEYMLNYFQRIAISNARFHSGQKDGWRTHCGRVYIMYGEPDEIERFPSSIGRKPYEIWYYHSLEGGVQFVFVDISGFGEYQLVHSTSRNEIQDYDWMQRWLNQ